MNLDLYGKSLILVDCTKLEASASRKKHYSRKKFATMIIEPLFENEVQKRVSIKMPTDKELAKELRFVLEDLV